MADDKTQRALHEFFVEHLLTLEPFTKHKFKRLPAGQIAR